MTESRSHEFSRADAQRIAAQHDEIRTLIARLEDRFAHRFTGDRGLADAGTLLRNLERRMTEHFELEEKLGFLDRAVEAAPRLARRAVALRQQHGTLEAHLHLLLEAAPEARDSDDQWRKSAEAFRLFVAELARHEEVENELEIEANMDDLGGGD